MDAALAELIEHSEAAARAHDALDVGSLADEDLSAYVQWFQQHRGGHEAREARVLGEWDRRKVWRRDGARTGAAWLASKQHLPISETRRRLRHARATRLFPAIAAAWAAGEIDRTHVTTLLGVRNARTKEAFEGEHEQLLESARNRGFVDFKRHCDVWELYRDPDGAEQGAEEDREARELHLAQSFGGMWFGKMTLDPITGAIVSETLHAIEKELFDADWKAAKQRLGRDPLVVELDRTPAQRRVDALAEMAIRARTAPADGRRPAPLFTVVVGMETFTGPILELFGRTVITPGTAARWLADADFERIVFSSPSRVIDVSHQRRLFTGALRRAIQIRDRTCYHPTCDEPPDRSEQIDHIHEASRGGPTTQDNGRLACGFHNRWRCSHPDDDLDGDDLGDPESGADPPR